MADSDKDKKPGKPPKIKPSGIPDADSPKPDQPASRGKETARVDLSAAKTNLESAKTDITGARSSLSTSPPDDTTRIDLPKPPAKIKPAGKTDTSKLDLAAARPVDDKDDTSRITLPHKKSETARIRLSDARPAAPSGPGEDGETQPMAPTADGKDDTYRIDVDAAPSGGSDEGDFSPATSGIETVSQESQDAMLKQSTMRVDLAEPQNAEPPTATRNQTMRVQLDDKSPGNETARVEAPPTGAEAPGSVGTARIPIVDEAGDDDVLKKHEATAAADSPELDEPDLPRSQTARIAAPVEAEKSKTARIEVPSELSGPGPGRPKTIRIKRADSTAGPAQALVPEPVVKKGSKGRKGKKPAIVTGDEVSTLYPVLALVSVIIICVVLYVLLAQTLAPSLPWFGKVSL